MIIINTHNIPGNCPNLTWAFTATRQNRAATARLNDAFISIYRMCHLDSREQVVASRASACRCVKPISLCRYFILKSYGQ